MIIVVVVVVVVCVFVLFVCCCCFWLLFLCVCVCVLGGGGGGGRDWGGLLLFNLTGKCFHQKKKKEKHVRKTHDIIMPSTLFYPFVVLLFIAYKWKGGSSANRYGVSDRTIFI